MAKIDTVKAKAIKELYENWEIGYEQAIAELIALGMTERAADDYLFKGEDAQP